MAVRTINRHQQYWDRAEAILALYKKGEEVSSISRKHRVSTTSVRDDIRNARTFPVMCRQPELSSYTSYTYISRLNNPITVLRFALEYDLKSDEILRLVRYLDKTTETNLPRACDRAGVVIEGSRRVVPWTENEIHVEQRPNTQITTVEPILNLQDVVKNLEAENKELRRKLTASEKIRTVYLKEIGRKTTLRKLA
jgi:hypothetical protein